MTHSFECQAKGCSPGRWIGTVKIIKSGNPCEAEVCALGNSFHVIVGRHENGNYLCIPNWSIGSELSSLPDTFWNEERLRNYTKLKKKESCTIVTALKILADYMK